MNKRRLLKLADLLETDAKNKKGVKFDLHIWGRVIEAGDWDEPGTVKVDCGTQACAIGLACISGAFKRSGLTYRITSQACGGGNNIVPIFGKKKEFDAIEKFFELSGREAEFLFLDHTYRVSKGALGERAVAKRIRHFVAEKITAPAA